MPHRTSGATGSRIGGIKHEQEVMDFSCDVDVVGASNVMGGLRQLAGKNDTTKRFVVDWLLVVHRRFPAPRFRGKRGPQPVEQDSTAAHLAFPPVLVVGLSESECSGVQAQGISCCSAFCREVLKGCGCELGAGPSEFHHRRS